MDANIQDPRSTKPSPTVPIDLSPVERDGQLIWAVPDVEDRQDRSPVSLDEVHDAVIASQRRRSLSPTRVTVDTDGKIGLVRNDSTAAEPLADVTSEVFSSARPSLDRIREQMLEGQRGANASPSSPRQKIVADRNGRIGFESDLADGRPLSEVTQEVFAGRLDDERVIARTHLPSNTREVVVDGVTGWAYDFVDEFAQPYSMWAFFDGAQYQCVLVSPEPDGRGREHDKHLFSDGYVCLSPRGGCRDLMTTFARSVLWANGYTVYRQTGHFPFSINNL